MAGAAALPARVPPTSKPWSSERLSLLLAQANDTEMNLFSELKELGVSFKSQAGGLGFSPFFQIQPCDLTRFLNAMRNATFLVTMPDITNIYYSSPLGK